MVILHKIGAMTLYKCLRIRSEYVEIYMDRLIFQRKYELLTGRELTGTKNNEP